MSTKKEVGAVVAGIRLMEIDGPDRTSPTTVAEDVICHNYVVAEGKECLLSNGIANEYDAIIIANLQTMHRARAAGDVEARDDENEEANGDGDIESVDAMDLAEAGTFDVEVIKEHSINVALSSKSLLELEASTKENVSSNAEERDSLRQLIRELSFMGPQKQSANVDVHTKLPIEIINNSSMEEGNVTDAPHENNDSEKINSIIQNIIEDFTPKGDQKILRAIGRTATVNAAILITAATGGAAGAIGYVTGGAITAKRLSDGIIQKDEKEVTKSLAVYGCATGASIAGQAITGVVMLGIVGASLPLAAAVAFGVGCCSGVTAGALSEWTVDSVMDRVKERRKGNDTLERCESDGVLLNSSDESSQDELTRSQSCRF